MKFNFRKNNREEIESLEDEVDNYEPIDGLRLYLKEMVKFPLLNREEQREIAKSMHEYLQEAAKIIFTQSDFSSKYFKMIFNESNGLENFANLMPDRNYSRTKIYLRDAAIETLGKIKFKGLIKGEKNLMTDLSKTNHDRKHLKEICDDLLYAREKAGDSKINELGFKSAGAIDSYLNKLKSIFKSYDDILQEFVNHNLRLVVKIANKYYSSTVMDKIDLIQEGNIGLIRAAEKFDYRKGYTFSSYAVWWINQSINRAVLEKSKEIRLPIYLNEKMRKIQKIADEFYYENHRDPTPEEIAKLSKISLKKVIDLIESPKHLFSLNEFADDKGVEFMDILPDSKSASPENEASHNILSDEINKFLEENLTPKQEKVLRMRYGLDEKESTLEEVGKTFGFCRERARQIEKKALRKLKKDLSIEQLENAI